MSGLRARLAVAVAVVAAAVVAGCGGHAADDRASTPATGSGSAAGSDSGSASHAVGASDAGVASTAPDPGADAHSYQGRPIASTCSYLGADWLERSGRAEREQPERVLDALQLDPHATVADVGAGTGYFSLRLARRVAHVYATDLQPEMLDLLTANAQRAQLTNITALRASEHDAALPAHCCDLVLLVDVYHELSDPPAIMAGIRRALAPHGRLVLIEYRADDPAVAIKPEHKMTLPQLQRELTSLGFHFEQSLEFLPDQRIVIFTVPAT